MQLIIKDAQGKALQSLNRIDSYVQTAANMLSLDARRPFSVWRLDTITGVQSYDGSRTQRLSAEVVKAIRGIR